MDIIFYLCRSEAAASYVLCPVWTAPALQGECDVCGVVVGCGHVSGLFARHGMAAGLDEVRGSAPHHRNSLGWRGTRFGLSRSPARPGSPSSHSSPSQSKTPFAWRT